MYQRYPLLLLCLGSFVFGCAPEPSLSDPYAENGLFWPYGDTDETPVPSVCDVDPEAPLGVLEDGTPVMPMNGCDPSPEGDFPICAQVTETGKLQVSWDGVNGFALFVTEPQAIIPAAPNTPVSEGETFWSIGPEGFPTDGFASPLTYQELPSGMEDVTTDHGGPEGGTSLDPGRCYKVTVVNKSFRRASVIVGWQ